MGDSFRQSVNIPFGGNVMNSLYNRVKKRGKKIVTPEEQQTAEYRNLFTNYPLLAQYYYNKKKVELKLDPNVEITLVEANGKKHKVEREQREKYRELLGEPIQPFVPKEEPSPIKEIKPTPFVPTGTYQAPTKRPDRSHLTSPLLEKLRAEYQKQYKKYANQRSQDRARLLALVAEGKESLNKKFDYSGYESILANLKADIQREEDRVAEAPSGVGAGAGMTVASDTGAVPAALSVAAPIPPSPVPSVLSVATSDVGSVASAPIIAKASELPPLPPKLLHNLRFSGELKKVIIGGKRYFIEEAFIQDESGDSDLEERIQVAYHRSDDDKKGEFAGYIKRTLTVGGTKFSITSRPEPDERTPEREEQDRKERLEAIAAYEKAEAAKKEAVKSDSGAIDPKVILGLPFSEERIQQAIKNLMVYDPFDQVYRRQEDLDRLRKERAGEQPKADSYPKLASIAPLLKDFKKYKVFDEEGWSYEDVKKMDFEHKFFVGQDRSKIPKMPDRLLRPAIEKLIAEGKTVEAEQAKKENKAWLQKRGLYGRFWYKQNADNKPPYPIWDYMTGEHIGYVLTGFYEDQKIFYFKD